MGSELGTVLILVFIFTVHTRTVCSTRNRNINIFQMKLLTQCSMYIKLSKPKILMHSFKHYKKLYKNKIKQYNGVLSSIRKREHWV